MRKAFLSPTAPTTQQRWYSLCKLKLLNTIITLFYGVVAIRELLGGALRYCHTFQLDPFLVANKTFLPASDPAGIRWSRPLYLWSWDEGTTYFVQFKIQTNFSNENAPQKLLHLFNPLFPICSKVHHKSPIFEGGHKCWILEKNFPCGTRTGAAFEEEDSEVIIWEDKAALRLVPGRSSPKAPEDFYPLLVHHFAFSFLMIECPGNAAFWRLNWKWALWTIPYMGEMMH